MKIQTSVTFTSLSPPLPLYTKCHIKNDIHSYLYSDHPHHIILCHYSNQSYHMQHQHYSSDYSWCGSLMQMVILVCLTYCHFHLDSGTCSPSASTITSSVICLTVIVISSSSPPAGLRAITASTRCMTSKLSRSLAAL